MLLVVFIFEKMMNYCIPEKKKNYLRYEKFSIKVEAVNEKTNIE